MATIVRMPEVLTGVTEAAVASWLVRVGDQVAIGAPLAEIETEKAVLEYVAEVEGTLLQVFVADGANVSVGEPIAVIGASGEPVPADVLLLAAVAQQASTSELPAAAPEPANAAAPELAEAVIAAIDVELTDERSGSRLFASPLVRRLAGERGLDLSAIVGSGPNGRIVRRDLDDVATTTTATTTPTPTPTPTPRTSVDVPAAGEFVERPLTAMRKVIARRLTDSKRQIPHFYLTQDVRMDALLEMRRQANENTEMHISVNDFVLKAVAGALHAVPEANATWGETAIRQYQRVDIAVAVAIDGGLVTPVLRDVHRMSVTEISQVVGDVAERARGRRLKQHELEGGSFSVSNLGMYGTQEFAAIINPPHAGILAVGAARKSPIVEDGELAVATVMRVTLSADHRVIDGAVAAQWLAAFTGLIEHPIRMLL